MKLSFQLDLEAHPGEPLLVHLAAVGAGARRLASRARFAAPDLPAGAVPALAHVAGATHDLGKATPFFQHYLHAPASESARLKADPRTRHALLGAAVAAALMERSTLGKVLAETGSGRIARIAVPWAVRRHHGALLSPADDLVVGEKDRAVLREQIDASLGPEFDLILAAAGRRSRIGIDDPLTGAYLLDRLDGVLDDLGVSPFEIGEAGLDDCLFVQHLLSVLLDADRSYALPELRRPLPDRGVSPAWVGDFRVATFRGQSAVDALRREAAETAVRSLESSPDAAVFQLTLPTGLGKTLVSLDAALRLRDRQVAAGWPDPAIVYALPYLSVLEQSAGVFGNVLGRGLGTDAIPTDVLMRHHHLAELRYGDGDREYAPNQAQLLVEGWRSSVVVTTTVQLFQSLFSGRTRPVRKLHRLAGAVLVLDEVQALPFRYWPAVREVLAALVRRMGVRILLVTATQPRFSEGEVVELVPDYPRYFERLERTRTTVDLAPLDTASAARRVADLAREGNRSVLVVMNTIRAALEVRDHLIALAAGAFDVVHLSTNLVPAERERRIADAARSARERPLVLVATQLVEAGVDLSFPVVVRDFAPMPSIVQAAGRCNRHWERESGEVVVLQLVDDRGRTFSSMIYDAVELDAALSVLGPRNGGPPLGERELLEAVERAFDRMRPSGTPASARVLAGARRLCFATRRSGERDRLGESLSAFQLIPDDDNLDVFLETEPAAEAAWKAYLTALGARPATGASLEARIGHSARIKAAIGALGRWTVPVPRRFAGTLAELDGEILRIGAPDVDVWYDIATGWRRYGN